MVKKLAVFLFAFGIGTGVAFAAIGNPGSLASFCRHSCLEDFSHDVYALNKCVAACIAANGDGY